MGKTRLGSMALVRSNADDIPPWRPTEHVTRRSDLKAVSALDVICTSVFRFIRSALFLQPGLGRGH
jgi:hypothetical protein